MIDPNPCKGCTERHPACHDHCEDYQRWAAQSRAEQQHLKEQKDRWHIPYSAARVETETYYIKHPLKGRKGGQQ